MSNFKALETIPFNYNEIYKDLEQKFQDLGYDAPYEGSNLAQLISGLSYIVSSLNFNTAVNINENLIHLAQKRKNVVNDALVLGYIPKYKTSEKYKITLKFKQDTSFLIKKYTNFTCQSRNFVYCGEDVLVNAIKGMTFQIDVLEGTIVKSSQYPELLKYTATSDIEYYDIPLKNVEDNGIFLKVSYYDNAGNYFNKIPFEKETYISYDSAQKDSFLRVDNVDTETPRIYFKYANFGKKLLQGSMLECDLLITSGINGQLNLNDLRFTITDAELNQRAEVVSVGDFKPQLIQRGADFEDIESIKKNAPLFYNSKNRAVTKYDYKSIANSHSSVKDTVVWGGEDEIPVRLGHIFYSFEPEFYKEYKSLERTGFKDYELDDRIKEVETANKEGNAFLDIVLNNYDSQKRFLSETELTSITKINSIYKQTGVLDLVANYKLPALRDVVRHPIYVDIILYIDIKNYLPDKSQVETRQAVFEVVEQYFKEISNFETVYFNANLIRRIEEEVSEKIGVEVKPVFEIILDEQQLTKQLRNINFSDFYAFYTTLRSYDKFGSRFTLSNLSKTGDKIYFSLNKKVLIEEYDNDRNKIGEHSSSIVEILVSSNDISKGYIDLDYDIVEDDIFKVTLNNGSDVIEAIPLELNNLENKKIFYSCKLNSQSSEIYIQLPRFARINDKIKIYSSYNNNNKVLEIEKIIDSSIYKDGYFVYTDWHKGSFAGIENPLSYEVEFIKDKQTVKGELCNNETTVKNKTTEQDNVFDNLRIDKLYFNTFEQDGKINFKIWVPDSSNIGDTITINYNTDYDNSIQEIIIDEIIKQKRFFEIEIEKPLVEILGIKYESISGYNIVVQEKLDYDLFEIVDVDDDSVNYEQKEPINTIHFTPTSTYDAEPKFNPNYVFNAIVGYKNKIDMRNAMYNWNQDVVLFANIHPDSEIYNYVSVEDTYLVIDKLPPSILQASVNLTFQTNGETYTQDFIISNTNTNNDSIEQEGMGGVYIYLDLPYENIFEGGKLLTNKLPYLESKNFKIDFTITKDTIKNILPYNINVNDFDSLNFSNFSRLSFPIYDIYNNIIGTYIIFLNKIPYIRIKFRKSDVLFGEQIRLKYPSDNINFIRNSLIRLREVHFDTGNTDIETFKV